MASLRSATRILARSSTYISATPTSTRAGVKSFSRPTTLPRPVAILTVPRSCFHHFTYFRREDDTFGSTGRRPTDHPTPTKRVNPKDAASNDAYPDGAPGEPKPGESLPSGIPPSTIYSFEDIQSISNAPDSYPNRLLIDVREPAELLEHGRIPNALNLPIKTAPDAFFMGADDFEDKYGFSRPGQDIEVIFYCKAGVRSKAAARLAGQAEFGGKYGEFPGSFDEWVAKGGKVQRE